MGRWCCPKGGETEKCLQPVPEWPSAAEFGVSRAEPPWLLSPSPLRARSECQAHDLPLKTLSCSVSLTHCPAFALLPRQGPTSAPHLSELSAGLKESWDGAGCQVPKMTGNSRGRYQARKAKDMRVTRRNSCLVLLDERITKVALGLHVSTVGHSGP